MVKHTKEGLALSLHNACVSGTCPIWPIWLPPSPLLTYWFTYLCELSARRGSAKGSDNASVVSPAMCPVDHIDHKDLSETNHVPAKPVGGQIVSYSASGLSEVRLQNQEKSWLLIPWLTLPMWPCPQAKPHAHWIGCRVRVGLGVHVHT